MSDTEKAEQPVLADIGRRIAELHTKYYGKGPSHVRAYMLNDTVICLLEGGFTTVEETLIADGNSEAVHEIRRSFQQAMEQPFKEVVEAATNRTVIAYVNQIHTSPNLAAELFVLAPETDSIHGEHRDEIGGHKPPGSS